MTGMAALAIAFNQPVEYGDGVRLQTELVTARIAGAIPDVVLFLEHAPVITLGVRAAPQHVLLPPAELERRRIALFRSSRGGDATWHGPGQLVMYPILRLGDTEADAHGYLHNLEEIAIRTAADFGAAAWRRPGLTGAWTTRGKLAAIGIRLKRWVAFHGMSFNVDPDLSGFSAIVPCGLTGEPVASLRQLLGDACPALAEVRTRMAHHFSAVCRRPLDWAEPGGGLPAALRALFDRAARRSPGPVTSATAGPAGPDRNGSG